MTEAWTSGTDYDGFIGRWSRAVAAIFVSWMEVAPDSAWLDFGCGTGALTQAILSSATPRSVVGCDRSADYVAHARAHIRHSSASFVVAELPNLPAIPGGFDAVVSGLVLNFLPDPARALDAFRHHCRAGALVGAYVWDYAEGMQLLRIFWDAAVALDPDARQFDEGVRFPLCAPAPLRALLAASGLHGVRVEPIEVVTPLRDLTDYWSPFLSGQGPAPGYVKSLSAGRRQDLLAELRRRLPVASDGTILLHARAFAAKGIAP